VLFCSSGKPSSTITLDLILMRIRCVSRLPGAKRKTRTMARLGSKHL
jgi:hypothetical protein